MGPHPDHQLEHAVNGGFVEDSELPAGPLRRRLVPDGGGQQADPETLKDEITGVLAAMGLRLSPEKTLITHIDEGLDFAGWRIQRHRKRGSSRKSHP
jgi:hypothetical protein